MKFLHNDSSIFVPECVGGRFLEFNSVQRDYYLSSTIAWDRISTKIYQLELGKNIFYVPSGMFIMIADENAEVDWILIDELIGRDISVPVISNDLKKHRLYNVSLSGFFDGKFFWPMSKNIIPLSNENNVILLTTKDQYQTTKDFSLADFLL